MIPQCSSNRAKLRDALGRGRLCSLARQIGLGPAWFETGVATSFFGELPIKAVLYMGIAPPAGVHKMITYALFSHSTFCFGGMTFIFFRLRRVFCLRPFRRIRPSASIRKSIPAFFTLFVLVDGQPSPRFAIVFKRLPYRRHFLLFISLTTVFRTSDPNAHDQHRNGTRKQKTTVQCSARRVSTANIDPYRCLQATSWWRFIECLKPRPQHDAFRIFFDQGRHPRTSPIIRTNKIRHDDGARPRCTKIDFQTTGIFKNRKSGRGCWVFS